LELIAAEKDSRPEVGAAGNSVIAAFGRIDSVSVSVEELAPGLQRTRKLCRRNMHLNRNSFSKRPAWVYSATRNDGGFGIGI
jgi:predicted ATP-grasp superfamily ATP-dependent carboligase